MVRSILFASAFLALVAFTSAMPTNIGKRDLLGVKTKGIGTKDVKTGDILSKVVDTDDIEAEHILDDLELEHIL